jgi:FkbM family methyltransferase
LKALLQTAREGVMRLKDWKHFGPAVAFARRRAGVTTLPTRLGPLSLRLQNSDLEVFRQVFIHQEYDIDWLEQAQVIQARYDAMLRAGERPIIVDAGTNVGAAALWFARRFPEAMVIGLEPDPDNFALAVRNTQTHGNIRVVHAALGGSEGAVQLSADPSGQHSWGIQTVRAETGEVPITTIQALLEQEDAKARLLIAKIDIEGFEDDVFEGDLSWLDSVTAVLIEPHDWMLPDRRSSRAFQRAFGARDFDLMIRGENLIYVRRD